MQQSSGVKLLIPRSDSVAKSQLLSKESANFKAKVRKMPQQRKASSAAHERRMAKRQSEKHLENKAKWQANKLHKKSLQLKKNVQEKYVPAFTSAVGGAKRKCEKPWHKGDRDFKDMVRDYGDVAY
jgi:hypothetical protein